MKIPEKSEDLFKEMLDVLLVIESLSEDSYRDVWRNGDHDTEHFCIFCGQTYGHEDYCPMPKLKEVLKKVKELKNV